MDKVEYWQSSEYRSLGQLATAARSRNAPSQLAYRADLGELWFVVLGSSLYGPCCLGSLRLPTKRRESPSSNPWMSAGRRSPTTSSRRTRDQARSLTIAIAPTFPTTTKEGR